jgi:hypothetical protein
MGGVLRVLFLVDRGESAGGIDLGRQITRRPARRFGKRN